jgi:hypothetical protein
VACAVSSSSAVLQSLKLALSFIPLVENPLHVFTMLMFNPTLTFFEMPLDVPRRSPKDIFVFLH